METESFKVDDEVADRVHDLVREALGLLMRGFPAKAYPRDRVEIAIRRIADILEQEAEIAVLHPRPQSDAVQRCDRNRAQAIASAREGFVS
jgi:hypothetical protein